jgi:hypothetical protein
MQPTESRVQNPPAVDDPGSTRVADAPVGSPPGPERRRRPRISTTPPQPAPPPRLDHYEAIIGRADLEEIRYLARPLRGKIIKMVNSTAVGGGVAEILNRLVPLLAELEVNPRWDVITGGNDFFEVTKAFTTPCMARPTSSPSRRRKSFFWPTSRTAPA